MKLTTKKQPKTEKARKLLAQYQLAIIEKLEGRAFDLLTPYEVEQELGIPRKRIPDLIREGWLEGASGKDIGTAHQYYRWRVEFVKQYRGRYKKQK